jgi:hypothetical protein
MCYELHLTDFSPDGLLARRLQVLNRESGAVLAEFAAEALAARMAQVRSPTEQGIVIAPGRRAPAVPGPRSTAPIGRAVIAACRMRSTVARAYPGDSPSTG